MTKPLSLVCCFCGQAWGYEGDQPTDELMAEAINHEKICPKNPYTAEIDSLRRENEALKGAVCFSPTFTRQKNVLTFAGVSIVSPPAGGIRSKYHARRLGIFPLNYQNLPEDDTPVDQK